MSAELFPSCFSSVFNSATEPNLPLFTQLHASICRGLAIEVWRGVAHPIHISKALMEIWGDNAYVSIVNAFFILSKAMWRCGGLHFQGLHCISGVTTLFVSISGEAFLEIHPTQNCGQKLRQDKEQNNSVKSKGAENQIQQW